MLMLMVAFTLAALLAPLASADPSRDLKLIEQLGTPKPKPVVEDGIELPANADADAATQVQQLLAGFRKSENNPPVRGAIVNKLVAMGGDGRKRITDLLESQYQQALGAYREAYEREAAAALRAKSRGVEPEQITELQKQVTDLANDPDLTSQKIREVADLAMAKLTELLTIDRDAVLRRGDLMKKRAELLDAAALRQRAIDGKGAADTDELERELVRYEQAVALTALSADPRDREVLAQNAKIERQAALVEARMSRDNDAGAGSDGEVRLDVSRAEAQGIRRLNLIRIKAGLSAQAIDVKLIDAARGHSYDMRTQGFFSHTSPVPGKRTFTERAEKAGATASGENIFYGSPNPDGAIDAWWYSPGHFRNMMQAAHVRVGLGRSGTHWTQLFGR
jgi:uncharacterized protein YkwD